MKQWKFPAGELGVQAQNTDGKTIKCNFKSSDDILSILFQADALRRLWSNPQLTLDIPYFPYARQDRVMNPGESHSLRVICDLINSVGFAKVITADPHSDVVEALVNNLKIIPQYECVVSTLGHVRVEDYDYLIAPDAGALKKIYKLAQLYEKPVICAQKTRSVTDGKITGTFISKEDFDSLVSKKALIVDDLVDGGYTFTSLRDILPTTATVDLYITHGIFSKGKEIIQSKFNQVFCYNDMTAKTV